MEKSQSLLFERKSNAGLLVSLALPAVVLMVIMTVYNMTDIYFIGKLGDVSALAAVSLAGPLMGVQSALGTLAGDGACSLVSRALGQKNGREKPAAGAALILSLGFGVMIGLGMWFLSPVLLPMLGGTEKTIPYALSYLRILAFAAPAAVFTTAFANIVRSTGAVREGMAAHLLGTVTNMILDPVFILLLGLGVRGAALATAAGNVLAAIALLRALLSKKGAVDLHPSVILPAVRGDRRIFGEVLVLGLPSAIGNLLMNLSHAIQNRFLAGYGEDALAAFSIGGKGGILIAMVAMGICIGMQPAFGYFYGAEDQKRLHGCLRASGWTASLVSIGGMSALIVFGKGFTSLFTSDPAVSALALNVLRIGILTAPFISLYYLISSFLQASGQAGKALTVSILRQGAVLIPTLMILGNLFELTGIFWSSFTSDLISTAAASVILLAGKKKAAIKAVA
ncbi:MAG: MATE family efflux transporter [Candidatus Faecivivens sp.]|nr:MATE family efflux transporter [Candidatus Faecivivens sp.]